MITAPVNGCIATQCIWNTAMLQYWHRKSSGSRLKRDFFVTRRTLPVLLRRVFEKLGQLEWIFADLLDGREQEAVDGDVDHLLEEAARLEEVLVPAVPHQLAQLHAGVQVVVTVFRVDPKAILL